MLPRLEDLPPDKPAKVLRHFDARLASAVEALQQRGMLEGLAASGGSSLQDSPASPQTEAEARAGGEVSTAGDARGLSDASSHVEEADGKAADGRDGVLSNGDGKGGGGPAGEDRQEAGGRDAVALGQQVVDFWLNLCLCHMLIVENGEGASDAAQPVYQVSLVEDSLASCCSPPTTSPLLLMS